MNDTENKRPYFRPWIGRNYPETRTVIMSESTYDWQVGKDWYTAQPDHPKTSVEQALNQNDHAQYFIRLTRALCNNAAPSSDETNMAWNNFAYTIYVQRSVGKGAGTRPTRDLWEDSANLFPSHFSTLDPKPRKIILTGKEMWNRMPENSVRELVPDVQAYRFDGELLWCLAIPHPANRVKGQGFAWQRVGEQIKTFLEISFPIR